MQNFKKDFHKLPETFSKKEIFPFEKQTLKKPDPNIIFIDLKLEEGIQEQLIKAIGAPPSKVQKLITPTGYTKKQIKEYIINEVKRIEEIAETREITIENRYGELFSLANNICSYVHLSKERVSKKDIDEYIQIIDNSSLSYSGDSVFGQGGICNLYIRRESGSSSSKSKKENLTPIETNLQTIKKLYEKDSLPHEQNSENTTLQREINSPNFENQYTKILGKLQKKYRNMISIGGKIHFEKEINEEEIQNFQKQFGFSSTPFKMIHANTSMLLPPSYFPEELALMVGFLQKYGLIEGNPQLQLSIPGRLPNRAAAMLGSCMLLSSKIHLEYAPDAFQTSHESSTGSKIIAYDDGVLQKEFQGIPQKATGRTDMMGIRDISLLPVYHLVGTLLSHAIYQGKFEKQGREFMKEYKTLLEKHNMGHLLTKERIHIPAKYNNNEDIETSAEQHYQTIKECTDKQKSDRMKYNTTENKEGLLVFEIDNLLKKYQNKIYFSKSLLSSIKQTCANITDTLLPQHNQA